MANFAKNIGLKSKAVRYACLAAAVFLLAIIIGVLQLLDVEAQNQLLAEGGFF